VSALLVLALAVLALLSPALLSSKVLAPEDALYFESPFLKVGQQLGLTRSSNAYLFDQYTWFHPDMLLGRSELHRGHIPSWDPYLGAGDPLWATEQHAISSPFTWPAMIFPFWQSLEWSAALKLFAAAAGMFLLLRHLRRSTIAAILGGLAFGLSSPLVDWLGHPHTGSWVLVPWVFLAIDRVIERGRWKDVLGLVAVSAACGAGGHPPSAVMVAYLALPWTVYRVVRAPSNTRGRRLGLIALGVVLGLLLLAVILLPTIEFAAQAGPAERGGQGPLSTLYTFVAPDYWGRPDKGNLLGGPINYVERTGYFGVVPLLLALLGCLTRPPRGPQLFFLILALASILAAIQSPASSVIHQLPLLRHVGLVRFVIGAAFAGAALAAYGVDAVVERHVRLRTVCLLAAAVLLPLVLLASNRGLGDVAELGNVLVPESGAATTTALATASVLRWAALGAVCCVLVGASLTTSRRTSILVAGLVVTAAVDLVAYNIGFQSTVSPRLVDPPNVQSVAYARSHVGHSRIGGGLALGPNVAQRFGLRDARIYRAPPLRRREDLWTALGGTGTDYALMTPAATRLADLFAVKYVFVSDAARAASAHFKPVPGVDGLLRNVGAYPRAWVAYRWRTARDERTALAAVKASSNLAAQPVIEDVSAPGPTAPRPPDTEVSFVHDGARSISLHVHATTAGQLILADTFYPGWKAQVDGRAVPIHPANVAFRAVAIPRGAHRVTFSYEPDTLSMGIWLSLGAVLVLAVATAAPWVRRRRQRGRHAAADATSAVQRSGR
jgi:hypothetical protein